MEFASLVETAGTWIDATGIAILIGGAGFAMARYLVHLLTGRGPSDPYRAVRRELGRAILLGLEFLVAADIIRTVAIQPTISSVAALGLVVLIRSFLSLTLELEIEGHWPWQRASTADPDRN
jgi:uncharacterized membrane protein